ncbi:hypothetical protein EVY24_17585, partial [Klebsiella pneumoniae]
VLIFFLIVYFCYDIYTTYSYRHNHLYNNDTLTTVFNYDFAKIVFCGVLIFVSIALLLQELLLNKQSH